MCVLLLNENFISQTDSSQEYQLGVDEEIQKSLEEQRISVIDEDCICVGCCRIVGVNLYQPSETVDKFEDDQEWDVQKGYLPDDCFADFFFYHEIQEYHQGKGQTQQSIVFEVVEEKEQEADITPAGNDNLAGVFEYQIEELLFSFVFFCVKPTFPNDKSYHKQYEF